MSQAHHDALREDAQERASHAHEAIEKMKHLVNELERENRINEDEVNHVTGQFISAVKSTNDALAEAEMLEERHD